MTTDHKVRGSIPLECTFCTNICAHHHYMSFAELLVVFLVATIVLSPKEIKQILFYFQKIQSTFYNIKKDLLENIVSENQDLIKDRDLGLAEVEKINFYLTQISNSGSIYQGEYDLEKIKTHYEALQNKISKTHLVQDIKK